MNNKTGYTHRAILLSHKKGDIMPCPASRKTVEMITLSEVIQRKTNIMISFGGLS